MLSQSQRPIKKSHKNTQKLREAGPRGGRRGFVRSLTLVLLLTGCVAPIGISDDDGGELPPPESRGSVNNSEAPSRAESKQTGAKSAPSSSKVRKASRDRKPVASARARRGQGRRSSAGSSARRSPQGRRAASPSPTRVVKFVKKGQKEAELRADYFVNADARVKLNQGQYERAIDLFDKVIQSNPNYAEAFYYRALAKAHLKDDAAAMRDYERAVEMDKKYLNHEKLPGLPRIFFRRAELGIDTGIHARIVVQDLRRGLKIHPSLKAKNKVVKLLFERCLRRVDEANDNGALSDFQAVRELDPAAERVQTFALAYDKRGLMKFQKNDVAGSVEDFEQALVIQADFELARQHAEEARAFLKKRRGPDNKPVVQRLDLDRLAKAEIDSENYSQFIEKLDLLDKQSRLIRDRDRLLKIREVTASLTVAVWRGAMDAAATAQSKRRSEEAWGHIQVAMSYAPEGDRRQTQARRNIIAKDYAKKLVNRATKLPRDQQDEIQKLINNALKIDPENESARRYLKRQKRKQKRAATKQPKAMPETLPEEEPGGSGFFTLVLMALGVSLLACFGIYFFMFAPGSSKEAKMPDFLA